ncbi:hypothetical protein LOAG_09422 [Loa loa]|uniref:Uncharacterized protein n=1 Tax=Loa loa TaxID=7209 RepID=A0A1S0TS27_LOALO|nr:hypothetical protein LOAG_09422 [Loa loa]EFO19072.2 hypothetical protein LOAG_09422 [Loa loa]
MMYANENEACCNDGYGHKLWFSSCLKGTGVAIWCDSLITGIVRDCRLLEFRQNLNISTQLLECSTVGRVPGGFTAWFLAKSIVS